jgi:secondary thiamine-phosphate synthase enzyme
VHEIRLRTARRSQLIEVTDDVRSAVNGAGGSAVLVYVPHTTAGVTVNERVDPDLLTDVEDALGRIVGDDWPWRHDDQDGPNAPSHVRASLMGPSVVVPLRDDGSLALGTWQGIFFCEFDGPRDRTVYVSVLQ